MSAEAIASAIEAAPSRVAAILDEELARGRVSRTEGGRWTLVPEAFPAGTVEALRQLA